MALFQKFNSFVEAVAEKVHDFGTDQLKIALTNIAPTSADAELTDLTEIDYTNCSTRNVTTSSSAQAAGLFKLKLADLILTAGGGDVGPFRYIVLYNDSATNKELVGWYDYGSAVTLHDTETFTIDWDPTTGALTLQ